MTSPPSEASAPSAAQLDAAKPVEREALMKQWCNGLRISHIAQSRAAGSCATRGRLLGTLVVVLSTIVGTAIFASLEEQPSTALRVATGLVSMAAAVGAALHTFLGYQERSAAHRNAAYRYGTLRRELESAMLEAGEASWERAQRVVQEWNELDGVAPLVSPRLHDRARTQVLGERSVGSQVRA